MNRRLLLKLIAATAVAGCGPRGTATNKLRVVVAGAGIVGASIAWINTTWAKTPRSYHSLSQDSVSNWGDLHRSLDLPV